MIAERYQKNLGSFFTEQNQKKINNSTIAVIGIGGNGGYIVEMIARLGAKKIICYDGDKYEPSNLNRQLFCTNNTIGEFKTIAAFNQLREINPEVEIESNHYYFGDGCANVLIAEKPDVIIRAADAFVNPKELNNGLKMCLKAGIPVIDSYLFDRGTRVNVHFPTDLNLFEIVNQEYDDQSGLKEISQPAFLCAISASFAVNEMTKLLNMDTLPKISYQIIFDLFENKIHLISEGRVVY